MTFKASAVSMGNPHLVLFVEQDPAEVDVRTLGPRIEHDDRFPEKTNVEFVHDRRRRGPPARVGARLGRDDGVRYRRLRRARRRERGRARPGPRRGAVPGRDRRRGPSRRPGLPDRPRRARLRGDARRGMARTPAGSPGEDREAHRDAPPVPVRRARPEARGQAGRGRGRDLARRGRPRPADAPSTSSRRCARPSATPRPTGTRATTARSSSARRSPPGTAGASASSSTPRPR